MMRDCRFWLAVAAVLAGVSACGNLQTKSDPRPGDQTSFPEEYRKWKKVTSTPILHENEKESWEIYANPVAVSNADPTSYPVGSVLVKEERRLVSDPSGHLKPRDLFRISVMFKVGGGQMSGWSFKAFDPATKKEFNRETVDPDGCYFCHADAKARDYVFSSLK